MTNHPEGEPGYKIILLQTQAMLGSKKFTCPNIAQRPNAR